MPQPKKPSRGFSFFGITAIAGRGGGRSYGKTYNLPQLKLEADREVYRPGDLVTITLEIKNPTASFSLLIEKLSFEIKGVEKLDTNWFNIPKPSPDTKQRRGEYTFMDWFTPTIVSNQIIASGATKRSEGFVRGRSYNIRLDDQVLLRFSPKNSDSTYYFSDMIGGTLTFFHEEGTRICLELSITLEMTETISRHFVHPSRKHSPTITKVHNDHHEVVADLVQTSFLFSIPMDGPMSFSTHYVSVQWALRFEFLTTPKNVDWTRFEHPLLIEERDKCEWVLPITVHATPLGAAATQIRSKKPFSLEPLWVRT